MKLYYFLLPFLLLFSIKSVCQKKILFAKSTTSNINIDGKISEAAWAEDLETATSFIMFEPDNGKPISEDKKTEVKVLYDNNAIYISALLYDNEPDKILKEITKRDVFGASDHFSVFINGFNDGQQDYRFYVSAAGVQMDCLATKDGEDYSWDAIWDSEVSLTNLGWVVEMKIPYAALRFSNAKKQTWGLNFMREVKRDVQRYTWNHIDTKIGSMTNQAGVLEGIENINTPTRLFFIPYTSYYIQNNELGSDETFKAGLDIKYGINDSFTLDAILVPEFGQTKFDNAILNLEPFEQQLDENRPFFTEGTNLFNIGNLFYSRRIGGFPTVEPVTAANEEITHYPSTADLINAVKVSGRTEGGLGIGFLNAITEKTFATVKNTDTDQYRKEIVEPLTNYNVLVFDQRFNQNSSVSFINTNTTRNGSFRDANVSGLLFDLSTKANSYNLFGDFKYSTINDVEDYSGFKTSLNFAKTRGQYRYFFSGKYISKNYDVNDLGIIFFTNYHSAYANGSYRIVNPTKYFNTFKFAHEVNVEIQNTVGKTQQAAYTASINSTTLKNDYLILKLTLSPLDRFDFYEPRAFGRYVYIPKSTYGYAAFETNQNNKIMYTIEAFAEKFQEQGRIMYGAFGGTKFRFNDQYSLAYNFQYTKKENDRGWVGFDNDDIIFGERTREIFQHDVVGKYAINNRMTLNLTARYYWSYSENHQFLTLQDNGYLMQNNNYNQNKDRNFNSWNFDLSYSWWFAPGSEISVLYRNYSVERASSVEKNLNTNFKSVFNGNLTNILSVSVRYFIDYNRVKNIF